MKVEDKSPLQWPQGFPRTKWPERSGFGTHTLAASIDEVVRQLELLRAESATISANGFVRSVPADKGVAVYFKLRVGWDDKAMRPILKSYVIPCDKWNKIEHNFWAVAKHIEAMRGQTRWGCGNLERDFMGYTALPESTLQSSAWHEVLQVSPTASVELIADAYRREAKRLHPDVGGSNEQMAALNRAYEQALKEMGHQ